VLYVHSVTLRGQFAYIIYFTTRGRPKQREHSRCCSVNGATRTCLCSDVSVRTATLFKLLARANADTVARHTTHLTYEMNIIIAMTFGLRAHGSSLNRTQHDEAEAHVTLSLLRFWNLNIP